MSFVLAFDCATPHLAVVLARNGRVHAGRVGTGDRTTHAAVLNVLVAEVLQEAGIRPRQLTAVAVGTGPGSYTGLRIAISAAKGFCHSLRLPIIGMPTLEVLGHQLVASGFVPRPDDRLLPMIDARRMEVYRTLLAPDLAPTGPATPLVLDDAWCAALPVDHRTVVFGDGADKATDLWVRTTPEVLCHMPGITPSLEGLARCATAHLEQARFGDVAYLVPEYGKPANVTRPRQRN